MSVYTESENPFWPVLGLFPTKEISDLGQIMEGQKREFRLFSRKIPIFLTYLYFKLLKPYINTNVRFLTHDPP